MEEGSTRKRSAEQAFGKGNLYKQGKEELISEIDATPQFEDVFFRECPLYNEDPQELNEFEEELVEQANVVPERGVTEKHVFAYNYQDSVLAQTFPSRFLPFIHQTLMFLYIRSRKNEERKAKEKAQENEKSEKEKLDQQDDRNEFFRNLCLRWILFSLKEADVGLDPTTCFFLVELMGLINKIKLDFGDDDQLPTRYQWDCTVGVSISECQVFRRYDHILLEPAFELLYQAKHPSIIKLGCSVLSNCIFTNVNIPIYDYDTWLPRERMRILEVLQPHLAHTRAEVRRHTGALVTRFIKFVISGDYQQLWQDIVARVNSINFQKVSEADALFMANLGQLVFIFVDYLREKDEDRTWQDDILPFLFELMERVTEPPLVVELFHCVARLARLDPSIFAHFDRLVPLLLRSTAYHEPRIRLVDIVADKISAKLDDYNLSVLPEDLKDLLLHRSNIKKIQMIREKRFQKKRKIKSIYRTVRSHAAATLDMLSTSDRSEEVLPLVEEFLLQRLPDIENAHWINRECFVYITGIMAPCFFSLERTLYLCFRPVCMFFYSDTVGRVKATCCWTVPRYMDDLFDDPYERPSTIERSVHRLIDYVSTFDQREEELITRAGTALLELIENYPEAMRPHFYAVFEAIYRGLFLWKGDVLYLSLDIADVLTRLDDSYQENFSCHVWPILFQTLDNQRKIFEEESSSDGDQKDIRYYATLLNAVDQAVDIIHHSLNHVLDPTNIQVILHCCIIAFTYEVFDEGLCRASLRLLGAMLREKEVEWKREEEVRDAILRALQHKEVHVTLFAFLGAAAIFRPDLLRPIAGLCFDALLENFLSPTLAIAENAIWAYGELLAAFEIHESEVEKFLLVLQNPLLAQNSSRARRICLKLSWAICIFVRYNAIHLHNTPQHNLAMLLTHVLAFDPVDILDSKDLTVYIDGLQDLWVKIVSTEGEDDKPLTNRIAFLPSLFRLKDFLRSCAAIDQDWIAQVDERIERLE